MASIIAHAVCAVTIGQGLRNANFPKRFWVLLVLSAMLPDIDVIGFSFGIEYGDFLGHRGFTHSLLFAGMWSLLLATTAFCENKTRIFIVLFLATASHGVLDAMTNGGLGIAFLSPFDNARYFFDFRPILVSPIGVGAFFSDWGRRVLLSEAIWIGLPCLLLLISNGLYRKIKVARKALN